MTEELPSTEDILKAPILNLEQVALLITPRLDEIDKTLSEIRADTKRQVKKFLEELREEAEKEALILRAEWRSKWYARFRGLGKHSATGSILIILYNIITGSRIS